MKENFHETTSDWLYHESSGLRHSYPSPGSLGQPMVCNPYVPIRNLWAWTFCMHNGFLTSS